ncbi:DUF433 domain-containing protein [Tumidithrix elongata RA019]|uniref:DUF433 domain-containing protein n=1 Tax=Tumidithrix elongata BACA0141 TaxID=2716417 RepID=A0AAW9PYE4_9CYAN|nr:DUF433 domain-containing protein [Tumidithrix elongata RA019]
MKLDRITRNPNRINGQPCIRNLRLTVRRVLELLATYPDRSELYQEFPELEEEDIRQALIYASTYLDDRIIDLSQSYETVACDRRSSVVRHFSLLFYGVFKILQVFGALRWYYLKNNCDR